MKNLLEKMVAALVDHPEDVNISEINGEKTVVYELRVNPDDVGKVIGKKGRTINAIRTVMKAITVKDEKKVMLELLQ
jgi:predicted RNA-binding protein YlqC (UPF0109 family)